VFEVREAGESMKRLWPMLALSVLLLPATARAEPIAISVQSSSGGFSGGEEAATSGRLSIDLGTVDMPAGSVGTFLIDGLKAGSDYTVSLAVAGISKGTTLQLEILDPSGGRDDRFDPTSQPSYVTAGYSTSSDIDGFSFAQGSGLQRSALFAGGAASVTVDEMTNRGDILMFTGLGRSTAEVAFGLRDGSGGRAFLLRISAAAAPVATPEPASMMLIGTGLVGLIARRRRRAVA